MPPTAMSAAFLSADQFPIANIILTAFGYHPDATQWSGLIMDNIQKLILGVLGISGMLAMLVPSGAGVAPPPPSDTPALAAANPEVIPTEDGIVPEEEVTDESESDEDVFLIGEPAIDGNPLQGTQPNYQVPQPAAPQFVPQQSFDYSQPAIVPEQSFATPQLPLPVPPPAN